MTRANVEEIMGETGERHFLAARDDGYWMWFHGKAGNGNVFIAWDTECVIETLWAVPDHDPPLLIHLWNRLAAALGP
jgi:hypothetical protein